MSAIDRSWRRMSLSRTKYEPVEEIGLPPHDEKKQIKLWYYYTNTSLWHVNPFVEMHTTPQILALRACG